MNSHAVLQRLATLRRNYWLQDFTFTPAQREEYNQLLRLRRARVQEFAR